MLKNCKKIEDVDDIEIYLYANFQNEMSCTLGSVEITNLDFVVREHGETVH
jgi:hypothetical protein